MLGWLHIHCHKSALKEAAFFSHGENALKVQSPLLIIYHLNTSTIKGKWWVKELDIIYLNFGSRVLANLSFLWIWIKRKQLLNVFFSISIQMLGITIILTLWILAHLVNGYLPTTKDVLRINLSFWWIWSITTLLFG